jgi:D-sedoheptulose 7-phosphate isomerase
MYVIGLTGRRPSGLGRLADVEIAVPSSETALIQEVHAVLVHLISDAIESRLTSEGEGGQ